MGLLNKTERWLAHFDEYLTNASVKAIRLLKEAKNGQMVTTIVARSSNFQRYREETLENEQVTILVK